MRKRSGGEVFRITGARQGLADDVRGRQRRYVISMSVRTVSVVLAAVLWNVERYVAVVALALGVLLPYVAVVIANAGRENTLRSPPPSYRHRCVRRSARRPWPVERNRVRRATGSSTAADRPESGRHAGAPKLKKTSDQS